MAEVAQLAGWVDRLDEVAVETAESMLHVGGILPPPTVHILAADLEPPYVGCLTCRPFYRGEDAWAAVAALGVLPSALGASRLVLTWEHADLCTALELPGVEGFPAGVVVVDAGRQGHTLPRLPQLVGRFGLDRECFAWSNGMRPRAGAQKRSNTCRCRSRGVAAGMTCGHVPTGDPSPQR